PDPARAAAIRQYPSQFGDVWFVITSSVWRPAGSSSTSQAPAFPASPAIAGDDEPRDAPVSQQSYAPPEPCCGAGSAAVTPFHANRPELSPEPRTVKPADTASSFCAKR